MQHSIQQVLTIIHCPIDSIYYLLSPNINFQNKFLQILMQHSIQQVLTFIHCPMDSIFYLLF
jgi:hypothetical protein